MNLTAWKDEIETAVVAVLCVFGGMLGTRMKYHANQDDTHPFDSRRFWSGLYLAAGAGLTTAMLGQGMHINKPFLIGSSIVAGYAGGRRFFEWIEKLLSLLTAKRLMEHVKDGGETLEKLLGDDDDDKKKEDDPP